jgi:DNA polymerase-1
MSERKKLAVIDGKSVFYRGYYAMPNLTSADGTPTGGVYGFATLAIQLMKQLKPDYVAVAWDKPKTNIRKRLEIYPKYKAGRKPPPADFYAQIPILHELLEALGWPLYELDDYEADDIMASLARQADEKGVETELVTSDLDALQAISDLTHVYILKKGLTNIERFHPESFFEKYGIRVDQFLDLKSLKGDSSDNIPGVPGIGEKTALELLKKYETMDGIYENITLIKDTTAKKLEAGKDSAYMSKKLAHLWADAPVEFNESELDGSKIDVKALKDLLEKLEFRTLIRQLPDYLKDRGDGSSADDFTKQAQPHSSVKNVQISDVEKLPSISGLELLLHARCTGAHGKGLKHLIVSSDSKSSYTISLGDKLSAKDLGQWLDKSLKGMGLVGHDTKHMLKVLINLGVPLPKVAHDVHLGAFLLNPLLRSQELGDLMHKAFGNGAGIDSASDDEFVEFAPQIVSGIWSLTKSQREDLAKYPKLEEVAHDIEWRIVHVLARMEYEGIKLDTKYLKVMSTEFEGIISDVEQEIYGHADQEFNISSPAQLSKVLFEDMGIPTKGIKKGKTAYSTAVGELDKLRWDYPIINLITQYREYTKLKSTYVDALPKLVDEKSRLHTDFRLTIAQTGRLSSADPNLQNIPVRTEIGKKIRDAFVAGEGNSFVSADYSQFELRLAAAMAGDKELIELFNQDADIHTETAAQIYSIQPHEVLPEQRRHAKVINFGILYGMSTHGLAVATGMSLIEAKEFLEKYKQLRKPLFDYTAGLIELAKKQGYVETIFGRRRPMPDIHSSNFIVRSSAERAAMNMPIQGTEADLMKMAMIKVDEVIPDGAKQLLQIHDSIMVECKDSQVEEVGELLVKTMENIYTKLPVKLKVDVKSGKTWGDL